MKMKFSIDKLKTMQKECIRQFTAIDQIKLEDIKKIAGFDITYDKDELICVGIIIDAKTFEILEQKQIIIKAPMKYIPGFLAFREGPAIMQVYYDFETEPDLIMIDEPGIAHPSKCGLATFVGVELMKPTIGISIKTSIEEIKDGNLMLNEEIVGKEIKTREHARPVYVSSGNMMCLETAEKIVNKTIIYPHKMPEALHKAHKLVNKLLKEKRNKKSKL